MTASMTRYEPRDMSEAMTVARTLVASRLLPRSIATPEAAFAVIMAGAELGLTAMQSLRAIHIVEGKPTLSADLMLALCKRSEVCQYVRLVESTPERATYEAMRKGEPEPTRMSFTIDEARAAGLVAKDNWKKYPAAMLRARCIAAIVRAVFPDVFIGVYERDELETADAMPREPVVDAVTVDSVAVDAGCTVHASTPDASPPATPSVAVEFASRIASCATADELHALGAEIARAKRAGRLSPAEVADLQSRYLLRRTDLLRPPSSPDVAADGEPEQ